MLCLLTLALPSLLVLLDPPPAGDCLRGLSLLKFALLGLPALLLRGLPVLLDPTPPGNSLRGDRDVLGGLGIGSS